MILRFSLIFPFSLASVSNLVFNANVGIDGIPCIYGFLAGDEESNRRCFHLRFSSGEIALRGNQRNDYFRDIFLEPLSHQHLRWFRLDRSHVQFAPSWREIQNYLGIGIGSDFGEVAGSIILFPGYRMIVNPTTPESFCYDEQLALANVVSGTMSSIEVSVTVGNSQGPRIINNPNRRSTSQTNVYKIETWEDTRIPIYIWNRIAQVWVNEGIRQTSHNTLEQGCERIIPLMPTIQFNIWSNGQTVGSILMDGSDYISVDSERGLCKLYFLPSLGTFQLGFSIIQKIGLFFDYRNNQIGFCEPA